MGHFSHVFIMERSDIGAVESTFKGTLPGFHHLGFTKQTLLDLHIYTLHAHCLILIFGVARSKSHAPREIVYNHTPTLGQLQTYWVTLVKTLFNTDPRICQRFLVIELFFQRPHPRILPCTVKPGRTLTAVDFKH